MYQQDLIIDGEDGVRTRSQTGPNEIGTGVRRVSSTELLKLIKKQQFRCALTGWELTPETATADHIVPLDKGGKHSLENIQIIHQRVNQAKGTLLQPEFIELCVAIAKKRGT